MRTVPTKEVGARVAGHHYKRLVSMEVRALKNQLYRIAGVPSGRAYLRTEVGEDTGISIAVVYSVIKEDELRWAKRVIDGMPECWDEVARKYLTENGYFNLLLYNLSEARLCDTCKEEMEEGYVICGGDQYYCSGDCLEKAMPWGKYYQLVDDGTDTYWTRFDD